ncbi:Extracellular exo-alpha-(1-_5)-L-arabinofuranosidase (ABF) (Alpha-L-AFase) (Extracellular arabinan exo-alpha-(1-_5)-L-arabinosidase) (Arabinosidase) [Hypsibius exemplaris]|uniref:Extracellular exo-alpha-(1->5)-L-arabinofuranosidase (ABF) (Alpha-L-AFase) (Extracellular arabinan exo-alpha-(1->5)-L-arabinosidase) (Arabinosidase) n=1 Tax=Hypsibius exemplaris TaxID=2072580 RepID=A0A9X6RJS0_HYPEX|nr:Extracellular exo-alpha-(1->5)-L-arabinofuranosidase (ABF) (Alpha-L-AFase) (Extracellular arabinan exo-alpha-(1->5)-L-arabinosidase) (Arabinosidase) [Hypsibius exemplaris]
MIFSSIALCLLVVLTSTNAQTFRNPILDIFGAADPWVLLYEETYYMVFSKQTEVAVYKSKNLGDWRNAKNVTVYIPPKNTMYSAELWAPEIHRIDGQFYIYFAASDGNNVNHKMYVLKADDPENPMGTWSFMGKIADPVQDWWAIDGTVLKHQNGKNYFIYSGWDGPYTEDPKVQHLFIAEMSSPTSLVSGTARILKSPTAPWEVLGQAVVEGPAIMENDDTYFLMYSAGASWTADYSTSMMGISKTANPLQFSRWWRSEFPVFPRNDAQGVYGPGHASFTTSPDGSENWIVYHALNDPNGGWGNRTPRAQKFEFDQRGFPVFPPAAGFGQDLPVPSGTMP